MIARRKFIFGAALMLLACNISAQPARDAATIYPVRPVRVVIGFTPGGQPDIVARMIAPKLSDALGQQFVIDNRPGAGGIVGSKIVADAAPDGHTLLTASSSHTITPAIYAKLPYDTLRDFAGITSNYTAAYILAVTPSLGVKTVQDLVAMAKTKPGQLNFSSAGAGSGTHFAAEVFKQAAQIDVVHVPYKGIPEALTDTIGGRVQFTMAPLGASLNLVREGRLRGVAVTSPKRQAVLPELPAIAEAGYPGFQWDSWGATFAPAKTPRAIINKLNREFVRALGDTDIRQRMSALGMDAAPVTPEQLDKLVAEQVALVKVLAQKAGISPR
jgi:tripartite-type tricarboxylate transporter receptor subunit TctC